MTGPRLQVFQSLWAMQPHDATGERLSLDAVCGKVAEAGFDGLAIDLGASDVAVANEIRPHMEREGLVPLIVAFPTSVEALRETLVMAKDFGAPFVDVVGQVFPLTLEGSIPVVRRWIEMADAEGMPIQFETHRNCITNDLFTTLGLLDAIPEMRLAGDFSHYLVDREFKHPLTRVQRGWLSRCIERCDSFQGRVASRQQIQLPIAFPQHRKWLELFVDLWREGFTHWRAREPGDGASMSPGSTGTAGAASPEADARSLVFLCELGPPEYAMTGADGRELSNRWEEGLELMRIARGLWDETAVADG